MKNLFTYIGLDRAIFYTLAGRGWGLTSGLVTLTLIVRFLTVREQGYYYTFASLMAMQVLFELGMSYVMMQFASHEMAHLKWTEAGIIEGNVNAKSRLRSLMLLVSKWYAIVAACIVVVILPVGWTIFSAGQNPEKIAWQPAWICLVLAAALNIFLMPLLAILEGCGRIIEVARLRMYQNMIGSFLAWLVLVLGGGIMALPAMNFGLALTALIWILYTKSEFLKNLIMQTIPGEVIKWKTEIWPFQWKIAVSWLSGYFIFQLFSPVLFIFRGAAEAGKMGMSMAIANALMSIAMAWMNTKAPGFGALVAKKDYATLDRLFAFAVSRSLAVMIFLGAVLCAMNYILHSDYFHFSNRILAPFPFAILLLASTCNYVTYALSTYLRAHKEEPFMLLSVVSAAYTCASTLIFAEEYGAMGVVSANLAGAIFLGLGGCSWIFYLKRREWKRISSEN